MKRVIVSLFVCCLFSICAKCQDSVVYRDKGWYGSAMVTHTFLSSPLFNRRPSNPIFPIINVPHLSAGYRLKSRIRAQSGFAFFRADFNKSAESYYYGADRYTHNDKGSFLLWDLQVKGYPLPPRFRLQPYLGTGPLLRVHWLQRNHQVYYRDTDSLILNVNDRFNGALLYWALNPGLQFRIHRRVEGYVEYNKRFLIGRPGWLWVHKWWHFPGFSLGVTYHITPRPRRILF